MTFPPSSNDTRTDLMRKILLQLNGLGAGASESLFPAGGADGDLLAKSGSDLSWLNPSSIALLTGGGGGVSFPNGLRTPMAELAGDTLKSDNGGALLVRGEFDTVRIQGEKNTTNAYDVSIVGKDAFGGPTASNIAGFYNDSSVVAAISKEGYFSVASSLRFLGRTSSAADPTTTQLPTDKDLAIHKNTNSGAVFLAYNDGGAIKKVALT